MFVFSLLNHAGFRASLLNRMIKYCLSYITDNIIIGRFLMKLYFFCNFSNIFDGSFTAAGSQRATAENGKARLINITALLYNLTEIHTVPRKRRIEGSVEKAEAGRKNTHFSICT